MPGSLPSRAAENLIWLGRYVERSEGTVRILRAYHARLAETSDPDLPLLADIRDYLEPLGIDAGAAIPPGLVSTLDSAVYSAGQIRDRFSPDGWLALRDLSKTVHKFATTVAPGDDATRAMTVILRKLAGFSGLLHENMYRFTGWRFLEIGRRLERGIQIARMLGLLARKAAPDGALDMMLEIGDSVMTHRRQYTVQSGRRTVVDLLALDPLNPRSVLFQLERLKEEIGLLPGAGSGGTLSHAGKEILRLHTALAIREPADLDTEALDAIWPARSPVSTTSSPSLFRLRRGMQYDIRLTMHYDYDYPVGGGRHQIRMLPLNLAGVQRVVAASLAVTPAPAERSDFTDFFGNHVTSIAVGSRMTSSTSG